MGKVSGKPVSPLYLKSSMLCEVRSWTVSPDWVTYWTLGNFLKPLATINLSKSPTFLGNFCNGVFNFSSEIIFGQLLKIFGNFHWSHCAWTTIAKGHQTKSQGLMFVSTCGEKQKRSALSNSL